MFKSFLVSLILLAIITTMFLPVPVSAHGAGPPFLLINGKYAQTNLYYLGDSIFKPGISWDNAADKYLVNETIQFLIDTKQFSAPKEIIENSTFRWKWGDDTKDFSYGIDQSHLYEKIGSYLTTIEAKSPDSPEFTLLDSVQIDVVASREYKMPEAKIALLQGEFKVGKQIKFVSQSRSDSSTSLDSEEWFLGENKYVKGRIAQRSFTADEFSTSFILLQVKDKNGLIDHTGVRVDREGETLKFVDISTVGGKVPVVTESAGSKDVTKSPLLYIIVVFVLGSVGLSIYLSRVKR
ncbi:MAG: hypothetical protein WD231_05245 [Candidatus Woykebacteria bacterium]